NEDNASYDQSSWQYEGTDENPSSGDTETQREREAATSPILCGSSRPMSPQGEITLDPRCGGRTDRRCDPHPGSSTIVTAPAR
ncbi:hypothetical protein, partial [Micromonospora orduensis]|uniref:hypothetical protein n=1 Tax=Micromonospora orduensis TaxID=1420891 RepID=UPI0033C78AD6